MSLVVTDAQLSAIAGHPVPVGMADEVNTGIDLTCIATHLQLAHYLGQTAWESGYYRIFEEPSGAHYEGRADLGNIHPGDGERFKGRGAIQLTGAHNYAGFGQWLVGTGHAFQDPAEVARAPLRWLTPAYYWESHPRLYAASQQDDTARVTRIINGGLNGLIQRGRLVERAIVVLGGSHDKG